MTKQVHITHYVACAFCSPKLDQLKQRFNSRYFSSQPKLYNSCRYKTGQDHLFANRIQFRFKFRAPASIIDSDNWKHNLKLKLLTHEQTFV